MRSKSPPTYTTDVGQILLVTKIAQKGKSSNISDKNRRFGNIMNI